jgi:hypothetical protein
MEDENRRFRYTIGRTGPLGSAYAYSNVRVWFDEVDEKAEDI